MNHDDQSALERALGVRYRSRLLFQLHTTPPATFWTREQHQYSTVFKLAHNGNSLHVAMVGGYAESLSSWPGFNEDGDADLVLHAINREQAIQALRLKDPA